jgi:predicted RNase H-like nuclease (RuvC/YqgF family)
MSTINESEKRDENEDENENETITIPDDDINRIRGSTITLPKTLDQYYKQIERLESENEEFEKELLERGITEDEYYELIRTENDDYFDKKLASTKGAAT